MGVIAKYKFNQELYANFIPEFNNAFINYTITDEIDADGYTIRTIESDNLPTSVIFGQQYNDENDNATPKSLSLLEVYEMDLSAVTHIASIFRKCENLTAIHCQFNCNFDIITNMQSMFYNCSSLTSLDVSNFNTENVTSMSWMFQNCSSLTSLDISNFNTEKVTDMQNMFCDCSLLTSLDVSNFKTEKVMNMYRMFYNCSSLISLDTSNFNTEKVTNMGDMFNNCSSLTSLDVSNFDTKNVTNMKNMFQKCSSLTYLDVLNFNTQKTRDMQGMFYNCSSLTSLDVSNFNTEKVTSMNSMFDSCSSLTSLDVSNFKTENVTDMRNLFKNCKSLTSIDVSNWNTNNVKYMYGMFSTCSSLTYLDLSSFNTKKVIDSGANTSMQTMFEYCSSLEVLDLSNFDTSGIEHNQNSVGQYMFYGNSKLMHISFIYASVETINCFQNSFNRLPKGTKIYYQDADLSNLISNNNIVYKEYKMNILESDEEIVLLGIGDVRDELNLSTGELTQRVIEIILDESITVKMATENDNVFFYYELGENMLIPSYMKKMISNNLLDYGDYVAMKNTENSMYTNEKNIYIHLTNDINSVSLLQTYLVNNPIKIIAYLLNESVKTINLKGKPSINWRGDTYLHLENNTLYPQLDCEIESINYYEIPKLKANTLYTLRYVGEPTQCIFGGLTYRTENNMILTSGSSDNLLYFDKEVRKVVLIEGDVRDRNFDYFEGIESLGAVEIVTHKSDMPIFAKGGRK